MKIKDILDEDFANYKKPSMFISTSICDFKCCKEAGNDICQNMPLAKEETIEYPIKKIVDRYTSNPLTSAIVLGGLEPLDQFLEVVSLIKALRHVTMDDIVIYTGYYREEIEEKVRLLSSFPNIIIKFGRFIPYRPKHFDKVLGVDLANPEQYAERIS